MPPWSRTPRRPVVPWRALAGHLALGLVAGVAVVLVLTWADRSWGSAALVGLAVAVGVTVAASVASSVPAPPPGPPEPPGRSRPSDPTGPTDGTDGTDSANSDDRHPPEP